MTDDTIDYCRQIMINHVLIIIVCLFLVVYVIINYNLITIFYLKNYLQEIIL